jgi:dTDP-4-dehydrorhamnose reductase
VKVAVTGAGGMLATALLAEITARGHVALPFTRAALDITDAAAVGKVLSSARPDVVVQCAAYTRVDDAEHEESRALDVNAHGTANVARACAAIGARFVYPGTDYVFAGDASVPYPPDAPTAPINAYGRTKLAGEAAARAAGDALVVRTSWLYGPGGRNFVGTVLRRARMGEPLRVVDDQHGAPTSTLDLAAMIVALLERGAPSGTYHATSRGDTTWYGLACAALELAGLAADITPCATADMPRPARRPAYSVLDCSTTYAVVGAAPHWRDALATALHAGAAVG